MSSSEGSASQKSSSSLTRSKWSKGHKRRRIDDDGVGKDEEEDKTNIPISVWRDYIIPHIRDRSTWNKVAATSREMREVCQKLGPPWPTDERVLEEFEANSSVERILFSFDSSYLIAKCHRSIHIWNRWSGKVGTIVAASGEWFPDNIACSTVDQSLAVAPRSRLGTNAITHMDRTIQIFDLDSEVQKCHRQFEWDEKLLVGNVAELIVHNLLFAPDGKILASSCEDMTTPLGWVGSAMVILWDVARGSMLRAIAKTPPKHTHTPQVSHQLLCFSEDSRQLLFRKHCSISDRHFLLQVWNVNEYVEKDSGKLTFEESSDSKSSQESTSPRPIEVLQSTACWNHASFTKDGRYLMTVGNKTIIKMFDTTSAMLGYSEIFHLDMESNPRFSGLEANGLVCIDNGKRFVLGVQGYGASSHQIMIVDRDTLSIDILHRPKRKYEYTLSLDMKALAVIISGTARTDRHRFLQRLVVKDISLARLKM